MPPLSDDDAASTELLPGPVRPAAAAAESFALSVMAGPDEGRRFTVAPGLPSRVLAGTSPACDIPLTDRLVSRRHAAFELAGARLRVTDLGSTNGTFVQGIRVGDAYLQGSELVRIGDTALRVEALGVTQAAELSPAVQFGRLLGASEEMRRLYPLCERLAAPRASPSSSRARRGPARRCSRRRSTSRGRGRPGRSWSSTAPRCRRRSWSRRSSGTSAAPSPARTTTRRGVFEEAHGGTLLLDEIGDLDLSLQAKLLRAIQRSEVQRVGGEPLDPRGHPGARGDAARSRA